MTDGQAMTAAYIQSQVLSSHLWSRKAFSFALAHGLSMGVIDSTLANMAYFDCVKHEPWVSIPHIEYPNSDESLFYAAGHMSRYLMIGSDDKRGYAIETGYDARIVDDSGHEIIYSDEYRNSSDVSVWPSFTIAYRGARLEFDAFKFIIHKDKSWQKKSLAVVRLIVFALSSFMANADRLYPGTDDIDFPSSQLKPVSLILLERAISDKLSALAVDARGSGMALTNVPPKLGKAAELVLNLCEETRLFCLGQFGNVVSVTEKHR